MMSGGVEEAFTVSNLQNEIDQNLDFFQKKLPELLSDHKNRYALLHKMSVSGIYDTMRDALTAGNKLYPDRIYSVQKISDQPINLGFLTHACGVD